MNVLCIDKTGTLTEGDIRLERAVDALGRRSDEVLRFAALNAGLQMGLPNPLDTAIIGAAGAEAAGYASAGRSHTTSSVSGCRWWSMVRMAACSSARVQWPRCLRPAIAFPMPDVCKG